MCQPKGSRKFFGSWGRNCCCCGCGGNMFTRKFISAKEEQERLEEYKKQLKNELAGVEERIEELKAQ